MVEIVWDEPKRLKNFATHKMDFADVDPSFFSGAVVIPAKQGRAKAIGIWADKIVVIIFLRLGTQGLSLISMRRANRHERQLYENA